MTSRLTTLRQIILAHKASLGAFAKEIGVSAPSLSRYLLTNTNLPDHVLSKMAIHLSLPKSVILVALKENRAIYQKRSKTTLNQRLSKLLKEGEPRGND